MAVKNPDIGTVPCPFTGEAAPLRRYRTGQRLAYFSSKAGQIKPNLVDGQKYIYERATFDDPEDKRQIGQWLTARGVSLEPEKAGPNPAQSRDIPEPDSGIIEFTVGNDPEPTPADPEPAPEPKPHKPAREPGLLDYFLGGDE